VEALAFGKYQLYERIAEGGMAVVWRAKLHGPGGFEKVLVLKQIRPELAARPEFIDLFVAEAKVTVSLTHANIVPVYELGMLDGTYFLALEYIDGPPLGKIIEKGPVSPFLAGYIVEQVLRGLDYAHRRGVVHRDLSSANVLVSRDGEVKIVDFGIAAPVDARAVRGGSRGYVAPEQEAGGRADARSDLYGVGVLLGELVTGQRWSGPPQLDSPLGKIIARATAADPDARYADAASMLKEVSRFLRDTSYAPNQLELSTLVRKRAPDVKVPVDDDPLAPRPSDEIEGPRTAAMPERTPSVTGHQVTFATRIASEPEAPSTTARPPRRRWQRYALVGVAGITLLGGALAVRQFAAPRSVPPPPPVVVAPPPPPAAPRLGHLKVKTDPPGAEVRLGDQLLGLSPVESDVPLDGPLALRLKKRGFQPLERTLAFGGTPPAASVVERLAPLGRGQLTLNALPWAHVTIDGEKAPDTPLQKLPLTAGAHVVRLQCPPTGRDFKLTVSIEPDQELRRVVDLRGEPKVSD
jgi:serine/threonine-protein kinase